MLLRKSTSSFVTSAATAFAVAPSPHTTSASRLTYRNQLRRRRRMLLLLRSRARRSRRCAAYYAEPYIGCTCGASRARVRRAIRAAAYSFAFRVRSDHPLRGVSAQIENQIFAVFALAGEETCRLQKRSCPGKLFDFFAQAIGVVGIW